ncbi:MAG TPA: glucan biosynthesis protein G [Hyphomicrobium sp.]|jgi:glucans biosynthesis protein|uniref:glucan biosynthesis protein n=1 Tax=Hyphomicrobium sp. TaxID=82 RepID=UPI002BC5426C|nr:glucan biosynthesis protein G [Hyphomicrobium sp.]HXE02675.1 glucan biosynthesis protein G [Hyphomicrobium sp.]
MTGKLLDRRSVLGQAAAATYALAAAKWALAVSAAQAEGESPRPAGPAGIVFSPNTVKTEAKRLSDQPFSKPAMELPKPFDKLSYDQYRDIRFRPEKAIWKDDHLDFQVQPFAMGWLYDMPVDLWTVENGTATRLIADSRLFSFGPLIGPGPDAAPYGFSGFRIHGPINRADYFDEYAVFQGASYLRAVGRDEGYGASARGLALNTARPGGEEFPFFRSFWLEKPKPGATEIVVHALLDSQSTTGAYRFVIAPGEITTMDVEAILYPRTALQHVGIAPLTSMFLHGQGSQRSSNDFRPAVHDSEGLAMVNGSGERIWRPLNNPKTLQVSAFMDKSPMGFGFWQRDRSFSNFEDLEAHYERRPSVWVEPKGSWGDGFVELIEIPADDEIHDNVVAYWKPAGDLAAGGPHLFAYKLSWGEDVPPAWSGARVLKTRIGASKKPHTVLFVIDLTGPSVKDARDLPVADVSGSAGKIKNVVVQRNPEISGVRVLFELVPGEADLVELRFVLKAGAQAVSETWLYRWTKP